MRYAYEGDKIRAEEKGLPKPLGYAYGISSGGAPDIPIYAKPVKPVYKHATLPKKELRKLESNLPNQLITKPEPRQNLHKEYNPYTQQYEVMSPRQKHMLDRAKFLGQDAPEFTGEPLNTSTMRPLQGVDLFKYRIQNNSKFEHGGPGPHPKKKKADDKTGDENVARGRNYQYNQSTEDFIKQYGLQSEFNTPKNSQIVASQEEYDNLNRVYGEAKKRNDILRRHNMLRNELAVSHGLNPYDRIFDPASGANGGNPYSFYLDTDYGGDLSDNIKNILDPDLQEETPGALKMINEPQDWKNPTMTLGEYIKKSKEEGLVPTNKLYRYHEGQYYPIFKETRPIRQEDINRQILLKHLGYDIGKIDGMWGDNSEEAWQNYLRDSATLPVERTERLESDLPNELVTKSEPKLNLHREYNPYTQTFEAMSPKQKNMLERAKYLGEDAPEFTPEPLDVITRRPLQGAELFKYRMQNDPNFRPIQMQNGGSIPEMNLGGLFGKKKSSGEYKPGSWAGNDNSEVKIYQEGEDAFDIPISKAPEAEFSIPEMSEEELQAYLIQSEKDEFERKYKAAYDKYKPETVSYKGIERPKAEFVLAEQYEANPQLYEDAGYTANKLESGNYELFQNKDISNMIYAKGFKPGVFENTYGMGSGEDIEKKFAPIYADAKRIHAERNAKKIDAMLKETVEVEPENYEDFDVNRMNPGEGARYSAGKKINPDFFQSSGYKPSTKPKYNNVEEVIDVLVSQGEGTKEGLTQRYMDYTNGLLKERDFDENLRNEAERIYDERFQKKRDELADEVASWDPQGIASVDQPILTPVTDISGNIEWKDNTAYSKNLDAIAEYENYIDNELQSEEYIAREALYAIANNEDLTNDQKKELLGDPEKLGNVMKSYSEYRAAPVGAQNAGYSGYYRGGNLKSAFNIDPENLEANWAAGTMPHVIDGGVDMLDEGWIKGTVGVIAAPAAFEALGSAMSYNLGNLVGAGSSAPGWLNMGNVFTGMGVKDVVTDIVPSAIDNVQSMASDGINKENSLSLAKDIFEGGTKLLSGTKLLNSMGVLKNAPKITNTSGYNTAKSIYGQGKYGTRIMAEELANNDHNVTDNMKFIKNLGIYMKGKKQYGGPTYAELTDAEIKKYREGGWIIEEI
jgi:hypothetical protein